MNHLDIEQVARLLDGEVLTTTDRWTRTHVAECGECRERVALAERDAIEIRSLLTQADHDPPSVDARWVAAQARGRSTGWQKWAAGIALVIGSAGLLYAAPGSPLRGWVAAAAHWITHRGPETPQPEANSVTPRSPAGIAVVPGERLVIFFEKAQLDGQARISLTAGAEVVVRAPAGSATFTSQASRLVIGNHGPAATFDIEIPRTATRVEVLVEGGRIFLKDGHNITIDDSIGGTEPYLLPLRSRAP